MIYRLIDYFLIGLVVFIVVYISSIYAINEYTQILHDLGYIKFDKGILK